MKKFISIVAALSMVASLSVTSFAAINVSVSEKGSGKATLVKESNGTFTADLATGSNTSQDTIVVVKGDGSEISTTSIQYINQAAAAQNFNFVLKDEPKFSGSEAQSATYTVLMGGDKVAKTEVGTITYAYTPDVTKYTIVFKAEDGTQISSTEYEEGATVTLPTDPTKAEDANYTYTFAGWKVEGAEDSTAVKEGITATGNLIYVPVFSATQKEVGGGDEGGEDTDEYTLTFLNADGTTFATIDTVDGAVVLPETEPTKANSGNKRYAFIGWYTDDALTTKIADATITASQNIYPKFVQIGVYGDANADGTLTNADITQIKAKLNAAAYKGKAGTSIDNYKAKDTSVNFALYGDANGDDSISNADITQIKAKLNAAAYKGKAGTDMIIVLD